MERKLNDEPVSATPAPKFTEPVMSVPEVIRSARRHPETGVLCFSQEEWDAEDQKIKEKQE